MSRCCRHVGGNPIQEFSKELGPLHELPRRYRDGAVSVSIRLSLRLVSSTLGSPLFGMLRDPAQTATCTVFRDYSHRLRDYWHTLRGYSHTLRVNPHTYLRVYFYHKSPCKKNETTRTHYFPRTRAAVESPTLIHTQSRQPLLLNDKI